MPTKRATAWLLYRAGLALAVALATACGPPPDQAGPRRLTIATGGSSGVYQLLGRALAGIYSARIPNVVVSSLETTGSGFNVKAVEDGRAELAFTQADVAYFSLHEGTSDDLRPYSHLRAIAVLYVNSVQIVVLRESNIRRLLDLQGLRVGVGAPMSGTEVAARLILQARGLEHRIAAEPLAFEDLEARMQRREVNAGFFVSSYPLPAITQLNAAVGIRLLPVEPELAGRIRADYPFFRPTIIPDGTYDGQGGDVATIGVDNLLVCRSDLPDELVYRLTRLFIESLSTLSGTHGAAASIDPERAPAAPIPLHPGAARFYRERELLR